MTPTATGDPRLEATESRVVEVGEGDPTEPLLESLRALQEEWTSTLDRELTGRLRSVFAQARDAHRAAMEAAGFKVPPAPDPSSAGEVTAEDPATPGDVAADEVAAEAVTTDDKVAADVVVEEAADDGPYPSFDVLRSYRQAMHRDVVRPILQALNEIDPGRRTGTLMDRLLDGLMDVARDAPLFVRRTAPADQYQASDEDSPLRGALKGVFKAGRGLTGLLRRSPLQQTVNLQGIAAAALRHDRSAGAKILTEALYQYHAAPLHRIEMALGLWIKDWMPLETSGHHAEAHLDPEDRERLRELREQLRAATVEAGAETGTTNATDQTNAANGPEGAAQGTSMDPDAVPEAPDGPRPAAVAAQLQSVLDEMAALPPPEAFLADLRKRFVRIETRLQDRVREGGTPFERAAHANARRTARSDKRREARREEWREWFDASIDRVRLTDEFLSLRSDSAEILHELYGSTLRDSVFFLAERVQASQEGLRDLRDRTPDADAGGTGDDADVAEAMASDTSSIEEEARTLLEERLLQPLQERNPKAQVEQAASDAVEGLSNRVMTLPRTVSVHPMAAQVGVIDPDQPVRTIPLREIARQGLDVLHLEGLRTTPLPLTDYLTRVEGECRQVVEMVAYSLSSAREALLAETTPVQEEPEDPDAPPPAESDEAEEHPETEDTGVEAAHTLSMEGLERAAESLQVILAPAITAWDAFAEAAHDTLKDGRELMYTRLVVAGTVQEQLRDVRSLVRSWWRGNVERARAIQRTYAPALRRRAMRLYIQGLRLVRRGQSAMGAGDTRRTERAAEVLGRIPELLEPLPLIYRRLYSFQPLNEPGLMVGRDDDRAWITSQYSRWVEGSCPPVVLTGAMAVGHTSFMNIIARELPGEDGTVSVVRLVPATRYLDETTLAARVARALWGEEAEALLQALLKEASSEGASGPPSEEAPTWTFPRLERALRNRNDQQILLLERLEHIMLRIPGGCVLAERFLAFQSRTAGQVFWVNSISDPAWKLLTTTEPHAHGLVQVRRLAAPDRKTMEELLLIRHRRSGVPIEFTEPNDLNPLLSRRLKRARAEKDRQDLLRSDFFDWLFRASQGNVLMAILLWLRSADFTGRPGWLRMKPSRAIRFAFLEEMDLPTSFALKAFLEHESLTLDEYARVFAVPYDEAFQALEVLRRKVLIDRLDTSSGLPAPVRRLEDGVRYRIPPIITQVIAQNLMDQNILH